MMHLPSLMRRLGPALVLLCACTPSRPGPGAHARQAGPVERPAGPMDLDEARAYMLALINHDRAEEGLEPVEMDDVAEAAAQRHVEDMTRYGYTGHWGTDGSVPEQRYTEAGGRHFVTENAACFFDGTERELDPDPTFNAVDLEKIEGAFMAEVPPADGHRRNILKPIHTFVGIGLAKPKGIDQACLAQEFVDDYGELAELPLEARVGQKIEVTGTFRDPVTFGAVGISRTDAPDKLSVEHLLTTNTYPVPDPYELYFQKGFKTPRPVEVSGNRFSIEVVLDDKKRPGRYAISAWGHFPDAPPNDLSMIALRTIRVR